MNEHDEWLSVEQAKSRIQRGDRQIRRYAETGKIRTRTQGRRVQYHAGDVEKLKEELKSDDRPHVPESQIIPAGDLLNYVRELQKQIAEASAREGYLRSQLETRPQLEDTQKLERDLIEEKARREALERELSTLRTNQNRTWILVIVIIAVLVIIIALLLAFGL